MKISFVIPCYCSEKNIRKVVDGIREMMETIPSYEYEMVLVNDCSPDNTIGELQSLCNTYDNIKAIDLVKNQGQPSALLCGCSFATGDLVVVGDDDGQTPYDNIPKMLDTLFAGNYDIVCAKYTDRGKRNFIRQLGTNMNEKMIQIIFEKDKQTALSAFFVARKYLIDEIVKYDGPYPYLAGLILRTTRNIGNVEMEQENRISGNSGYNWSKLIKLWVNGFTTFSIKPLRIASFFGVLCAVLGFFGVIICVARRILFATVIPGWTSLISLISLFSGIIMLLLGIIGEYLGRIYICINKSPQYVVKRVITKEDER